MSGLWRHGRYLRPAAVLLTASLIMSDVSAGTVVYAAENVNDERTAEYERDDSEESHSENIKSWLGTSLTMSEYGGNQEIITKDISKDGDGSVISSYDRQTKTLTISGNGEICKYLLPDQVEKYDIENVIVGGDKIKLPKDCEDLFSVWSNLKNADLSGFDTSNVTTMYLMFSDCNNLESLDLSGFDTSKVIDMSFMFNGCNKLESLDLSGFDTSKVTDMCGMFYGCNKLESLDLSGFDTSKVTNMGSMFRDCTSLKSLDLSSFDTSNVTGMYWMFDGCNKLESLDLSGFDTSKVTTMYRMFYNCTSLKKLDLSGFEISNNTDISGMFSYCESLETLKTPKKTNRTNV